MSLLDEAILKFVEWTINLRSATRKKEKGILQAATIREDNCCILGKWLHGEGKTQHGTKASFANLVATHADCHRDVSTVTGAINAGKFDAAETMLGSGSRYRSAFWGIVSAIAALEDEIGRPLFLEQFVGQEVSV